MIEANKLIFASLDSYCAGFDITVTNTGAARWIATNHAERRFLVASTLSHQVHFSSRRKIGRFDLDGRTYFCCIGFENARPVMSLVEDDLDAGVFTSAVAELRPRPSGPPAQVEDTIGGSDKSDAGYTGHPWRLIAELYPAIRVFVAKDVASDSSWEACLKLCLDECASGDSWIEPELADTLAGVCDLSGLNLPYETLCRSVFDTDPSAMFLALYRCIEAVYAYSGATRVAKALKLTVPWDDVAVALEEQIGWHAREDGALAALMQYTVEHDQKKLFQGLGETAPSGGTKPLSQYAAERIYALRNGLVHYRPTHRKIDYANVNWNIVCSAVAAMVCHMYSEVFP